MSSNLAGVTVPNSVILVMALNVKMISLLCFSVVLYGKEQQQSLQEILEANILLKPYFYQILDRYNVTR